MKNFVTNRQIIAILLLAITGYGAISLPKDAVKSVGTGAWFTISILTIIFITGAFFISSLSKIFEGKTLFEYSTILLGKVLGNIINGIYTLYFLIVSVFLTRGIVEFINECYLPFSPIWALLLLVMMPCAYIGYKGIISIGRFCEIFGILLIAVFAFFLAFSFKLGDVEYIKPLFEGEKIKEYIFGIKDLMFAFLGIEILTIIPFGKENVKKGVIYSMLGVLLVGLFYIYVVETSIMIVGINAIVHYDNAFVEALREMHLPSTFLLERVDILYITIGISGIIGGLSVVYFSTCEYLSKFFAKFKRDNLFIIFTLFIFVLCTFFVSYEITIVVFNTIIPIIGIFTAFIIPITLYILSKGKRYGKK